jgi:hypothetical protein
MMPKWRVIVYAAQGESHRMIPVFPNPELYDGLVNVLNSQNPDLAEAIATIAEILVYAIEKVEPDQKAFVATQVGWKLMGHFKRPGTLH